MDIINTRDIEDGDDLSNNKRRRVDVEDSDNSDITSRNLVNSKNVVELTLQDNTKFFLPKLPS